MKIVSLKERQLEIRKKLHAYQTGDLKPVVTKRAWLDSIFGGLIPGDIVVIGGGSGSGKSHELGVVKRNIMSKEINPEADDFIWLSNSLEMRLLSNVLRDLSPKLRKSKGKILREAFTDEEAILVKDYFKEMKDGRFFLNEQGTDAKTFGEKIREFLDNHKDKSVFIDVDHIALQKGKDKKKDSVDDVIEEIQAINREYDNVFWIILSQLNRNILLRIREKDNNAAPNRGDLYQSDTIYQAADYLYVTHNPQRLGITDYLKVNREVYGHLSAHFSEVKGNRASFKTHARVFFHALKIREASTLFDDIYIEEIEFEGKEKFKSLESADNSESEIDEDMPVFDKNSVVTAWGGGKEEESSIADF